MTNEQIEQLALANGFKLKEQPDGSMGLNPYVFEFARKLLADEFKRGQQVFKDLQRVEKECNQLRKERDELAAHVDRMADVFRRLHLKSPSPIEVLQSYSYVMREAPAASLARRDARMKAEALEGVNPHDLSRLAKSIGKDAWEMNPIGICKLVNLSAYEYRKQSGDSE